MELKYAARSESSSYVTFAPTRLLQLKELLFEKSNLNHKSQNYRMIRHNSQLRLGLLEINNV